MKDTKRTKSDPFVRFVSFVVNSRCTPLPQRV